MPKASKPDPALIAVLINREHSRLSSQVKTLEKALHAPFSDKEHQRLIQLAAYRQQSPDQEKLHYEVVFQAGVYRMGHWALVKHFVPGVTDCLDNFGSVLPKHRDAFKRRYEVDGNLSVEAQSQLLKAQYALIPNRRDPYRHEEMKRRGLVTADGIVPMGVKEALALIEREEAQATQPAKRGVVAWVADRFRRR